jgi:hypothetical protein
MININLDINNMFNLNKNELDKITDKLMEEYMNSLENNKIDSQEHLIIKNNIIKNTMELTEDYIRKTLNTIDCLYEIWRQ